MSLKKNYSEKMFATMRFARTALKRIRLQIADSSVDHCQDRDARMGFHIVGYVFGIPVSLFWSLEPHLMIRFLYVLNPTSTNPKQLYVKPVNAAASRASSLHLSLIIALAESVRSKSGKLAVSGGSGAATSLSQEILSSMSARRPPHGLGPKSGITNPQAPAPAYSDRLSQLEKDMAEIRDGTIKEVLKKLRRLSYEIEDINRRFTFFDGTVGTLGDLRVKVDRYEAEMVNLRRQVELGSTPTPHGTSRREMMIPDPHLLWGTQHLV